MGTLVWIWIVIFILIVVCGGLYVGLRAFRQNSVRPPPESLENLPVEPLKKTTAKPDNKKRVKFIAGHRKRVVDIENGDVLFDETIQTKV